MSRQRAVATLAFLSLWSTNNISEAKVWGGFDASRLNYAGAALTGSAHTTLHATIMSSGDTVGPLAGVLTPSYLSGVDVFYTSMYINNQMPLFGSEQLALQNWVAGGGVLVVTADVFNATAYTSMTGFAGVDGYTQTNNTPASAVGGHPLATGITTLGGISHVTFNYDVANATLLASNAAGPFAIALDSTSGFTGSGCMVVIGDHNAFTNSYINNNDNLAFLNNLIGWASTCQSAAADGNPCLHDSICTSGNCVDGVCCNTACGGAQNDCQACSVGAGATSNGTCQLLGSGVVCRASSDACDAPEVCDGFGSACPADLVAPTTTVCRQAFGTCDVAEHCDGTSAVCPADGVAVSGTVCRPPADLCDAMETCDGASTSCPPDASTTAGMVCRPAVGDCDEPETCDGASLACPSDAVTASGTVCRAATGICDLTDQCDGLSPSCPPDALVPDGAACDDGDPNTNDDECAGGVCLGAFAAGGGGAGGAGTGAMNPMGGSGGEPGNGGSTATAGGMGGDASTGGSASAPIAPEGGGCGCHVRGSREPDGRLWVVALALVALALRRKRRSVVVAPDLC